MKIVLDTNGKAFGVWRPILVPTTKGEKEFIKAARLPNGKGCRPWVYKTLQWINGFGLHRYILENPLDTSDWDWDCEPQCCIDQYEAADAAIYDGAKNDQEWFDGEQPEDLFGYTPSNVCLLTLYHLFKSNGGKVKMGMRKKYSRKFARIKKVYAHLEELRIQYRSGPKYMTFAHEKEIEEEREHRWEYRRKRKHARHSKRFGPLMMDQEEVE